MQKKIETEIGTLYLVASARGLRGVFWSREGLRRAVDASADGGAGSGGAAADASMADRHLQKAERQIHDYLRGRRRDFDLPLDIEGTAFQKKVWALLRRIPYGKTRSYKEIAGALGVPKASRAVGAAIGRNPLCLIVPCHRVIGADGGLCGYVGGLPVKRRLLSLEGLDF